MVRRRGDRLLAGIQPRSLRHEDQTNRVNEEFRMAADINIYNPDTLGAPLGMYSHVARVKSASETVYLAGMLSADKHGNIVGKNDFDAQAIQVFDNLLTALESAEMGWANVVQFTTYLVDSRDIAKFMRYREVHFPKMFPDCRYPPNTLLILDRLVHEEFLMEVQAIAAK